MKTISLKKKDARRGAAMVEMALVLPIFLMLIMGIIEFGRGMMVSNLVTNAAREGARMAVLDGSTNAEVQTAVQTFLQGAVSSSLSTSDIAITITVTPAPGNPNPANVLANTSPRDLIAVKVALPFNKVALIPGKYLAGKTLTGNSDAARVTRPAEVRSRDSSRCKLSPRLGFTGEGRE